jgi:hypothetical protein
VDKKAVKKIHDVAKIALPFRPISRPNKADTRNDIRGKAIMSKYILF